MKTIQTLLIFLILSILVKAQPISSTKTNSAPVDNVKSPTERAQHAADFLQQRFRLDDAQKAKVYDIFLEQSARMDSLRTMLVKEKQPTDLPKVYFDNTRGRYRGIFDGTLSKINALLTSKEQKKAFDNWKKESFYTLDPHYEPK